MKFCIIGPVISEEKVFENLTTHTHARTRRQTDGQDKTDRRTTEAYMYLYYKLTYEIKGSGELKHSLNYKGSDKCQ